ncbi:MAG: hypothetical protein P1V97_39455, partial [Planctomycetota bacterium]|nr:hypothetical protein [Planctomycetota bacterium]
SAGEDQTLRIWDWQGRNEDADKRVFTAPTPTDSLRFETDFQWESIKNKSSILFGSYGIYQTERKGLMLSKDVEGQQQDLLALETEEQV